MKLSKRDTNLLLLLLGILIFVGAYSIIQRTYNLKIEEVRSEISSLQPRREQLHGYYANLDNYHEGIIISDENVKIALARYPNDVRSEDLIMYARKLEKNVGIDISSISLTPPALITQFTIVTSNEGKDEYTPSAVMATSLTASCTLSYEQYKKLSDFIRDEKNHTTLDSIDVSFNSETGGLIGAFSITKYFICGDNYVYIPTDVPNVTMGTQDPFGTFAVVDPDEETSGNSENQ